MRRNVIGRLLYLDAGRGLAALVVLVHHVMVFNGARISERAGPGSLVVACLNFLSELNGLAVMFFFFISGWSIFLSVERTRSSDGRSFWLTYLWHRARRILPVFWLALLWSWFLLGGRPDVDDSISALIGNVAFLQTSTSMTGYWFAPFSGNGPLWSLSYEVWYYLALPPLVLLFGAQLEKRFQFALFGSVLIGVAAIALNCMAPIPLLAFASLWPVWMAGYLFASRSCAGGIDHRSANAAIALAGLLWLLTLIVESDTLNALLRGYLIVACAVYLVRAHDTAMFDRILELRPAQWATRGLAYVGLGSYSIYIFHYPLLKFLSDGGAAARLTWICASVVALVLLAPAFETWLQSKVKRLHWFNPRFAIER